MFYACDQFNHVWKPKWDLNKKVSEHNVAIGLYLFLRVFCQYEDDYAPL